MSKVMSSTLFLIEISTDLFIWFGNKHCTEESLKADREELENKIT